MINITEFIFDISLPTKDCYNSSFNNRLYTVFEFQRDNIVMIDELGKQKYIHIYNKIGYNLNLQYKRRYVYTHCVIPFCLFP